MYACESGDNYLTNLMFERGADPTKINKDGLSAIGILLKNENENFIDEIISGNPEIKEKWEDPDNLIHQAVIAYNEYWISYLMNKDLSVNHIDKNQNPPIFYAIRDGELYLVNFLLKNGAVLNSINDTVLIFSLRDNPLIARVFN